MKKIVITKKTEIHFNDKNISETNFDIIMKEIKNEYEKKYFVDEASAIFNSDGTYLYVTFVAKEKGGPLPVFS